MVELVGFVIICVVVYFVVRGPVQDKEVLALGVDRAKREFGFNPDYIARHNQFAIESETKRILINYDKHLRVYEPSEVISYRKGSLNREVLHQTQTHYYIEFNVKDLDKPSIKVAFGNASERNDWFARLGALYS